MLALIESPPHETILHVPPSTRAVVSWNSLAGDGEITARVHRADGGASAPLRYAAWSAHERRSFSPSADGVRVDVDVIRSEATFHAIAVESTAALTAVAVSVPDVTADAARANATEVLPIDVPAISQYDAAQPGARGWCSAASTAMLLGVHGVTVSLDDAVRGVTDAADGSTGNWAFNAAFAGAHGLRAAVAHLRGIEHALAFVRAGLPVAISIAWNRGELSGAAVEHSAGHLLVVRGADARDVLVNDPARSGVLARYPRAALDRVFRAHGGVAYLIAPAHRSRELAALANRAHAAAVSG